MIVDRQGFAYAGNFGFDLMGGGQPATAALVRVDPDGSASVAADDLWFPNGMVITDDGTLIVAETFGARFTAFTIQADGTLTDRRVWAQVQPAPEPGDTETMLGAVTFAPGRLRARRRGTRLGRQRARRRRSAASLPAARSSRRSRCRRASASSRAGSAATTAARSSPAPRPTSTRRPRKAAREAVLLTTTVDVPHAGLP